MSFKLVMHPTVSKAEIEVFKELSKANLTRNMVTQQTIVLKKTVPDFMWISKRKIVFLDGAQVHSSNQTDSDIDIDNQLELQGWQVLRIRYNAPLTQTRLKEVVDEIKRFIEEV